MYNSKRKVLMGETYFKSVVMVERLHRLFLEVVGVELEHIQVRDINSVQCLCAKNKTH